MFVQRPSYIILTRTGGLQEIFCKACGTSIGGVQETIKGRRREGDGRWVEDRTSGFRRFSNYVEIKMQFEDGSFHVTNGCRNCLNDKLTPEQLQELHHADMDIEGTPSSQAMKERKPVRVVVFRPDAGGIV